MLAGLVALARRLDEWLDSLILAEEDCSSVIEHLEDIGGQVPEARFWQTARGQVVIAGWVSLVGAFACAFGSWVLPGLVFVSVPLALVAVACLLPTDAELDRRARGRGAEAGS